MFAFRKGHGVIWFSALMAVSLLAAACAPSQTLATATNLPVSTNLPAPATYTPNAAPAATTAATAAATTAAATAAPTAAAGGQVNAFGVTLPADAAPPAQQFIRLMANERTVLNFAEGVYNRTDYADMLATPLVRINKNFEIVPAGAESWEGSADGKTWTYHLDKNSDLERRQPGHRRRLCVHLPIPGRPQARLGLYLVLERHPQLGQRRGRQGGHHRDRRQGGR